MNCPRRMISWAMAVIAGSGAMVMSPAVGQETGPAVGQVITKSGPSTVLSHKDMRVTIALPDAQRGFYRGTRFDWSGMITDVTLGKTHFYGPWFDASSGDVRDFVDDGKRLVADLQSSATGPAEEFIGQAGTPPPGYTDAPVGGTFLKIGVGRLRKPDEKPYDRFRSYEIAADTGWTIKQSGQSIRFLQHIPADASGYGYDYEKTVSLEADGVLVIAHHLRNTGTKPIVTQVYNHNFMRFNGKEIGPDVSVHFPYAIGGSPSAPGLATIDGAALNFVKPLAAGERVSFPIQGSTQDVAASRFTVVTKGVGEISAIADRPVSRVMFWSIRKVVAVEPFIALDLPAGGEQSWTWRYSFSAK